MDPRAAKALQILQPFEEQLLENHLIVDVTLERLTQEQWLDRHAIRKRIKRAIHILRDSEKDLPWHLR